MIQDKQESSAHIILAKIIYSRSTLWNDKIRTMLSCGCCGGRGIITTAKLIWWVTAEDDRTGVLVKSQWQSILSESAWLWICSKDTNREKERDGCSGQSVLCRVRLTQALAHGHAVLLWVEIVAVASTAPVYEANALPLTHVEVPAGHGGTAGASFSLQGAHRCQGTAC